MYLFSSVEQVCVDKFSWRLCPCTSFAATNTFPMSPCVSAVLALQAGRTRSSFLFSTMGMVADVGLSAVPSAGALPPHLLLFGPFPGKGSAEVLCFPRVWGGKRGRGGGSGGRGEALGWRAVSSALAARKYWSLGLPVALQYCIAALVRLEIGPCRRSWGSGSWGAASAPPRCLPRCCSGALVSHTNKPLRRQQRTRAWCR